ncbi:hypothetical protein ABIA99_005274 [Bradyrhizobium sp. LB12.1]|uniref:hypothetical protein n=1 Tax=Bradyrhizobium sp. LB12.1 TaxID=3156327 RepID=UPI0033931AD3
MSEIIERDAKTGQFKVGHIGHGGRPKGSRAKFSESFVADLAKLWEAEGDDILRRLARDEPGTLLRSIVALMPKDVNLNVGIDVASFAERFRTAYAMLGNAPPARPPRPAKLIDHD